MTQEYISPFTSLAHLISGTTLLEKLVTRPAGPIPIICSALFRRSIINNVSSLLRIKGVFGGRYKVKLFQFNVLSRRNKNERGKMRIKIVLLATLVLALGQNVFAQSITTSGAGGDGQTWVHRSSPAQTVEELVNAVAGAWGEGNLGSLDARRPYVRSVKVIVEGQVGEPPMIWRKTFRTLAQVDRWFKKRETAEGPGRNIGRLKQCSKGVCTFEQEGMLHNNLYLKKITYGMRKGQPYIKAIYIDDGA